MSSHLRPTPCSSCHCIPEIIATSSVTTRSENPEESLPDTKTDAETELYEHTQVSSSRNLKQKGELEQQLMEH